MKRFLPFALILLLAGCSAEKPEDTADPAASEKWIVHCRKEAAKSSGITKASWLIKAYNHAVETDALTEADQGVPDQVLHLSRQARNFQGFSWAIDHGARIPTRFPDLMEYTERGHEWRDKVYAAHPETLPVFMSFAVDSYDRRFFADNATALMETGFDVPPPLERTEFKIRYREFVGVQLDEALDRKDEEKIRFLISVTPKIENFNYVDVHTVRRMRRVSGYVFNTLKDEQLAIDLINLNWFINPVDFETLPFGDAFRKAYSAKPGYVVRMQGLDEWDGKMSSAEAQFILTLPESGWAMLAKTHLDELTEESVKMIETDYAAQVIAFKAKRKPLTQADYNELVNWALRHGNKSIFDFVMAESGELDIFRIDLGALAENQKLFEYYAPRIMSNLYYTLDEEPREDGTTIGRLKRVFSAKNENAGLWLVWKYDLSEAWEKGTEGRTLLMDVCEEGNLKAARFLVEKRGEKVWQETGYSALQMTVFGSSRPTEGKLSPIFFAAKSGNTELIKYLVSKGANVNARSNFHTTPLMHAVSSGKYEAVKLLLSLRADVNARMNPNLNDLDLRQLGSYDDVSTAYRRARSKNDQKMMMILRNAGANP